MTSMLRSPVSHLFRNECDIPIRVDTSRCVSPFASLALTNFWSNES